MNRMTSQRLALVTGAAQGIGLATAIELLKDGRKVILTDLREPDLQNIPENLRSHAWSYRLDVSDAQACQKLIEQINNQHGGVDILVNNAGVSLKNAAGQSNGILEVSSDEVQTMIAINVLAILRLCQLTLPQMKAQG